MPKDRICHLVKQVYRTVVAHDGIPVYSNTVVHRETKAYKWNALIICYILTLGVAKYQFCSMGFYNLVKLIQVCTFKDLGVYFVFGIYSLYVRCKVLMLRGGHGNSGIHPGFSAEPDDS